MIKRHTAICRGAILKGLMEAPISVEVPNAPTILSTISRTCLGVNSISRFVEGVHRHKDKYLCPAEGIYKAKNQMSWYIEKVGTIGFFLPQTCILTTTTRARKL